jgi:hypothetical protein
MTGGGWLRQGARVLALRRPDWQGLVARPGTVLLLIAAGHLVALAVQRALMAGEPQLQWTGLLGGWPAVAVTAWLCWVVAASRPLPLRAVPAAALFTLACAAGLVFGLGTGAVMLALRMAQGPAEDWPVGLQWAAWLLPLGWAALAQAVLLWRTAATAGARLAVAALVPLAAVLNGWLAAASFWVPEPEPEPDAAAALVLDDEVVDAQPRLLAQALDGLQPPRPGRVNLYGLTYAPYASEDVFMRESDVVATTLRERFAAEGRVVELVVNPATATRLPWATPLHLRRAIGRMAALMDRERDVLFLHLTSHGGADGQLAVDTAPLQTQPLTPELLRRWLDEAGVRWRVISVSACYSGSWIAPLEGEGTLVMTAADADHTSYGCGKRSPLTFFGRAMYAEALREGLSFREAHARSREVIAQREREAGKSDGYSNPQISEGAGIRAVLDRLDAERRGD